MVLAHSAVSVATGFYRPEYRNGNPTLLFRVRMECAAGIDNIIVFRSRRGDWRRVLPGQDIQAKAGNQHIQEEIQDIG
jgi:hypothetical protein